MCFSLLILALAGLALIEVNEAKDFHTFRQVTVHLADPKKANQKVADSSSDSNGLHIDGLNLQIFEAQNLLFDIDLLLNYDLLPQKYFQKYHRQGEVVIEKPSLNQADLCHYQGRLKGQGKNSWAAISTCNTTIHGVIYDGEELWHLHQITPQIHHLYQHSHQHEQNLTCGYDQDKSRRVKRDVSEGKNANEIEQEVTKLKKSKLKGPWNANKQSRYVELVLVVDKQEYMEHNQDLDLVYRICKDVANVMNALYSPLNIYIALVGVVVWTEHDEINLSTDGDTTLKNFLHYRKERLVKEHPNDNAQLLTGIHFEGGVVGKALKGPICTYEFSGGVNMWHSDVVGLVATTVAHEMGHNFGMDHDKDDCECPDDKCIMAPASSTMKPTFWSSCSLEYLALAFEHGMDYCLRNKPEKLFQSPVCGNSFVEPGEECDCGLKDHCDNPCCNPETCTLFANATCATGECCDFSTCQPKSPGSSCRPAEHECDLPEFCDGLNEYCPADVYKVDGIPCKVGSSFCYKGTCRTHSDQCRLLWGPSGKKSDNQCYEQNKKGTRHGNCGYDRVNDTYIACEETDVRCGMLHCQHLNERLEFGTESAAILSHSFINSGGRIIPCRTALVDLGLNDVDPGLAPEGARCDDDSLCVNRKCIPVASLVIGPASCPGNCNNHGICNSKGHCHCDVGFAPPYCDAPGSGGSSDSGPASTSEDSTSGWLVLLYILLMLIPICIVGWLVHQKVRRSDWRLLIEKAAKPRKRLSEVDPLQTAAVAEAAAGSLAVANKSGASSPTQALLPHVDTSTSALSTVITEKMQGESEAGGKAASNKSRFLSSIRTAKPPQFMQNLAKSISLPSPKLRAAVKTMATYEIKVEHQAPKEDESSEAASSPMVEEIKTSSKDSVIFIKEEKVETTLTLSGSKSLTTFGGRPIRSTLASSFRSNSLTPTTTSSKASTEVIQVNEQALSKDQGSIVASIVSSSISNSTTSSSQQPLNSLNEEQNGGLYSQDPKLAFPHSSSFAGRASTKLHQPLAAKTSHSANSLKATADTELKAVSSSSNKSEKSSKESSPTAVDTKTTSPTKAKKAPPPPPKPIVLLKKNEEIKTTVSEVIASKPTTSVTMPLLSKTSTLPWGGSTSPSDPSDKKPTLPKSSTLPLVPSRPVISRPVLQTATPTAASLISKSHSTGVSQSSILSSKEKPEVEPSTVNKRASRGVVFCDPLTLPSPTNPNNPPIIHIQPKTQVTTPPKPTPPSTVASPTVTTTTTTLASSAAPVKPIEAKAVIVSSVITPTWSTEPKAVASGIVLCHIDDTDSGSEPSTAGSPQKEAAPIASPESDKVAQEATIINPKKSLSKLKSKLVKRSQSEKKERRTSKDFDVASSPTASVKSSDTAVAASTRPLISKLDISGPILQPNFEVKTANLLPVCRSNDVTPTETEAKRSISESPKVAVKASKPPPITPRKHKKPNVTTVTSTTTVVTSSVINSTSTNKIKRPASIATTRPSRPNAPPPRPPPQRPNVGGSPTRSDTSSLASLESASSQITLTKTKAATENEVIKATSPLTSPLSLDDFDTPLSSPIIARRSPDALSTTSSSDGDLMREILKDLDTDVKEEVSTLMRKKNKNKKPPIQPQEDSK